MARWVTVVGRSMEPTLRAGQRVEVRRFPIKGAPSRGDIVVFHPPVRTRRAEAKRVVGLPGEEVVLTGGRVSVNGETVEEPYARIPPAPPGDDEGRAWSLGADEYFLMGDNRLHSTDSRHYGPVKAAQILGKIRT